MFNPETCVNLKFFQVTFSTRQQGSENANYTIPDCFTVN